MEGARRIQINERDTNEKIGRTANSWRILGDLRPERGRERGREWKKAKLEEKNTRRCLMMQHTILSLLSSALFLLSFYTLFAHRTFAHSSLANEAAGYGEQEFAKPLF